MNHRLLPIFFMLFCTSLCTAQSFELKKEHDSLYYINGWRLPYPVYQFQTGDVDGDGHEGIDLGLYPPSRTYLVGASIKF